MSVELSLEEGYAGLKRVELLASGEDYFWFQVVEGCGYNTTRMNATEARAVAQELNEMADKLDERSGGEQPTAGKAISEAEAFAWPTEPTEQPVSLTGVEQLGRPGAINIIFDGPPSHESGRFVEVENDAGASIHVGEWIDRGDGTWALRIRQGL